VNERARIRRLSPNGSDRERRAGVQAVGQGFSGLDLLVLLHQGKRTLINVTVGRGFTALDLLVLFHQVEHPDRVGGKRTINNKQVHIFAMSIKKERMAR
jgi:hypothetical protein